MLFEQFLGLGKNIKSDDRYKTDEIFYFCFRREIQGKTIKDKIGTKKTEQLYNLMKNHKMGYDFFGDKLEKAPLVESKTSWRFTFTKETLSAGAFKSKYGFELPIKWKEGITNLISNDSPRIDFITNKVESSKTGDYKAQNGWLKVWEEKSNSTEIEQTVKNYDTKLFELGGFKMTENLKKIVEKDTNDISSKYEIVEVIIESSTDKTPLTQNLKNDLKTLKYSENNQGLSKARANQIKQILISNKIDESKIKEINLFEQGDSPKTEQERLELVKSKEGYDPQKRYVQVKFKYKKKPGENFVYYQRIEIEKKGKLYSGSDEFDDSGKCGYDK
jgi:hypothetical protein